MRVSRPVIDRLLHSLVLIATAGCLAACGGGGGGGGSAVTYVIGGVVNGLSGTLVIRNNGGDDLSLTSDGAFGFATPVAQGAGYAVTVSSQPAGQVCTVTAGAGIASAAVNGVSIACTAAASSHPIGGNLNGLAGTVQLQNNGGDALSLSANGSFRFPTLVAHGAPYSVTVASQPVGQLCAVANATGIANAGISDVAVTCTSSGALVLLAGNMGGVGNVDGTRSQARFQFPVNIAVGAAGDLFVTDNRNHTVRRITATGIVTTVAGTAGLVGRADGNATAARFNLPWGVAIDGAGNLFVSDSGNHTVRRITPAGVVSTFAGSAGVSGSTDAAGAAARFNAPRGMAIDGSGNLYVADSGNNCIRRITPAGVVSTFAGTAQAAGTGFFNNPSGLAVDAAGNVYVANTAYHEISVITPAGQARRLAGSRSEPGNVDGSVATARFFEPKDVAVDGAGNVFVADSGHTIRRITPDGTVGTFAGAPGEPGSSDGSPSVARFNAPYGLAVDGAGSLYVADAVNHTIRKITPAQGVTTLAGAPALTGNLDGSGAAARFDGQHGLSVDAAGQINIADGNNGKVRTITPAGVVGTLAGRKGCLGFADGPGAVACFSQPRATAVDGAGNIYVADSNHHTIRRISPAGVVSTFAGLNGSPGYADGTGSAARFSTPIGVATDNAGNVFVVDTTHAVRKITPAGVVSTLAGSNAFGSADGVGGAARFSNPTSVATDSSGNVFVVDGNNYTIRKITPGGVVTTLAGTPGLTGSVDATGPAARFGRPIGMATDAAGNLYVADGINNTVRKITPSGVVSTVVGVAGRQGFVPGPLPGVLSFPKGLAMSGTSLYISMEQGVVVAQPVP